MISGYAPVDGMVESSQNRGEILDVPFDLAIAGIADIPVLKQGQRKIRKPIAQVYRKPSMSMMSLEAWSSFTKTKPVPSGDTAKF